MCSHSSIVYGRIFSNRIKTIPNPFLSYFSASFPKNANHLCLPQLFNLSLLSSQRNCSVMVGSLPFPGDTSHKEPICQCRRHKRCVFDLWFRKVHGGEQPTPVFLPEESHGQRSLAVYSLWGRNESDITEQWSTYSIRSSHGKNILFVCLSGDLSNDLFLDFNGRIGLYF